VMQDGAIRTDLAALVTGNYQVRARFCGEAGCSDWSEACEFVKVNVVIAK